jgi:hypothetical protein
MQRVDEFVLLIRIYAPISPLGPFLESTPERKTSLSRLFGYLAMASVLRVAKTSSLLLRTSTSASFRSFSVFGRAQSNGSSRPPRPIEDSTSALDYKTLQHRRRPPPLPVSDLPRTRTAEETVTNILYNTPPPSEEPYKK